jgi:hypothetical protein
LTQPSSKEGLTSAFLEAGILHCLIVYPLRKVSYSSLPVLAKNDIEDAEINLFNSGTDDWLNEADNIVIGLHGDEARDVFLNKIGESRFAISKCDELTVCLGSNAA